MVGSRPRANLLRRRCSAAGAPSRRPRPDRLPMARKHPPSVAGRPRRHCGGRLRRAHQRRWPGSCRPARSYDHRRVAGPQHPWRMDRCSIHHRPDRYRLQHPVADAGHQGRDRHRPKAHGEAIEVAQEQQEVGRDGDAGDDTEIGDGIVLYSCHPSGCPIGGRARKGERVSNMMAPPTIPHRAAPSATGSVVAWGRPSTAPTANSRIPSALRHDPGGRRPRGHAPHPDSRRTPVSLAVTSSRAGIGLTDRTCRGPSAAAAARQR
jgi:hypothetical protein